MLHKIRHNYRKSMSGGRDDMSANGPQKYINTTVTLDFT